MFIKMSYAEHKASMKKADLTSGFDQWPHLLGDKLNGGKKPEYKQEETCKCPYCGEKNRSGSIIARPKSGQVFKFQCRKCSKVYFMEDKGTMSLNKGIRAEDTPYGKQASRKKADPTRTNTDELLGTLKFNLRNLDEDISQTGPGRYQLRGSKSKQDVVARLKMCLSIAQQLNDDTGQSNSRIMENLYEE